MKTESLGKFFHNIINIIIVAYIHLIVVIVVTIASSLLILTVFLGLDCWNVSQLFDGTINEGQAGWTRKVWLNEIYLNSHHSYTLWETRSGCCVLLYSMICFEQFLLDLKKQFYVNLHICSTYSHLESSIFEIMFFIQICTHWIPRTFYFSWNEIIFFFKFSTVDP